jgi:hypothetical protein
MSNASKGLLFYGYVEPEEDAWEEAWELHWGDGYDDFNKLAGRLNVEWDSVGAYDFTLSCIRLASVFYSVDWNETEAIEPSELMSRVTDEHRAALLEFAAALGIDLTGQEPGWYLGASYG